MDENLNLQALVDMGSNGIRFSISDLSIETARILPTIYQNRASISLYDEQYSSGIKAPIPQTIIKEVVSALLSFRQTCEDFGVPNNNIRVLATEATREAINSVEYRNAIKEATGWEVEMLPKEDEGRIGAMGVASSFNEVCGLLMDLGGGSTQMTWMSTEEGNLKMGDGGSVSLPYGAAALLRRLQEADSNGSRQELQSEVESKLKAAFMALGAPEIYTRPNGNQQPKTTFDLYLSGGGFRGWGYVLMSTHPISPYPIPIMNGFTTTPSAFLATSTVAAQVVSSTSSSSADIDIFRISDRRASQIPAVAFLITCLTSAIPQLSTVRFSQGGVREGALFATLPASIRAQHPLTTAVAALASTTTPPEFLANCLNGALPAGSHHPFAPYFIAAVAGTLHMHAALPKETRPAAALRCTTTGALAAVHGVSHEERALLALVLCERWGAELSPVDQGLLDSLRALVGAEKAWWCGFLGRAAGLLGEVWPAGVKTGPAGGNEGRLRWSCAFVEDEEKRKGKGKLELEIRFGNAMLKGIYADSIKDLEKCGKKKFHEKLGWGLKVGLTIT